MYGHGKEKRLAPLKNAHPHTPTHTHTQTPQCSLSLMTAQTKENVVEMTIKWKLHTQAGSVRLRLVGRRGKASPAKNVKQNSNPRQSRGRNPSTLACVLKEGRTSVQHVQRAISGNRLANSAGPIMDMTSALFLYHELKSHPDGLLLGKGHRAFPSAAV